MLALPSAAQQSPSTAHEALAEPSPAANASDSGERTECSADLCLHDGLFYVWAQFEDPRNPDQPIQATGKPLSGDAGGILYAWSEDNPELLVKVLDGCRINGHWWVFVGSATDQQYAIVVKHIPTDESRFFESNGENALLGLSKTDAFAVCE